MTLQEILKRTKECGDCLLWTGSFVHGNAPVVSIGNKKLYVKRLVMEAKGIKLGNRCASYKCGQVTCVNPDHLVAKTKKEVITATAATGAFSTNAVRARVAAGKRRISKLSQEAATELRNSDEPMKELAARHGITEAYGYMIRRGQFRRDYSNPFSGLIV